MGLGLLGALSGLGQGMTSFGNSLFAERQENTRRDALQKIADTNYERQRADFKQDLARSEKRQDMMYERGRTDAQFDYDQNRVDSLEDQARARGWQLEDREANNSLFKSTVVGDDGQVIGIAADGSTQNLFQLAKRDPLLSDAIEAFKQQQLYIRDNGMTEQDNPQEFQTLGTYQQIMLSGFRNSQENLGRDVSEGLNRQGSVMNLGLELFSGKDSVTLPINGVDRTFAGQDLLDAQNKWRQQNEDLYNRLRRMTEN